MKEIFRITFPISPLCHVQSFQTPCIYLRSHISLGFPWPSSFLQLYRKRLFQSSPPAARQDIGHTFGLDKAGGFPLSQALVTRKTPLFLFLSKATVQRPLKTVSQNWIFFFDQQNPVFGLHWLLATDYWLLAIATPPVALCSSLHTSLDVAAALRTTQSKSEPASKLHGVFGPVPSTLLICPCWHRQFHAAAVFC